MGGNALKNTSTRRYEKDEYERISKNVVWTLRNKLGVFATVIPSYREKSTFGDLDVLCTTHGNREIAVDDIKHYFNPSEIVKNGSVISFNVESLQVDVIHTPSAIYKYGLCYFSYNDLGNLIGKLAHKFGLKHGHRGLTLPLRDGDNMFAEIVLTTNHDDTLAFLGLDVERYHAGFDTLEDIFKFVASSDVFNPDFYLLENLNAIARIRDRKRATYNKFLEWCRTYDGPKWTDYKKNKEDYLPYILDCFPAARPQFESVMMDLARTKYLKTKFNGVMVADIVGLSGKELGQFMAHLKTDDKFTPSLLTYYSPTTIENNIKEAFDMFKESA